MHIFVRGARRSESSPAVPEGNEAVRLRNEKENDESAENNVLAHIEHTRVEVVAEQKATEAGEYQRKNHE